MKTLWVLLTTALISLSSTMQAAQTAHATLFCWSLRFQQGQGSFDETLDLSTIAGAPNGELAPVYTSYTHKSGFALDWSGFPVTGTLYLDLPPFADANDNGWDDSFEVSQAAGGTSQGQYTTAISGGTVTATWSRAAGSKAGTCLLRLVDNTYGDLGTYRHTFEVLELTGPLTYTPGSNTVSGSVNLTNETDQLRGLMSFAKSVTNPHDRLALQSAALTNAAQQIFTLFESTPFYRDTSLVTNYYGRVEFNDGDLNTATEDYYRWELSIDDPNDTDHDGIPDFSDEPTSAAPRRPLLTLSRGDTNLWLTISGDTNRLHTIQEINSLSAASWSKVLSLTLTNDPQTVSLPLPATWPKFWRAQAE